MILRIAAVVVALSNYALAQFFSLATDAGGSRLYFATPLRQKNTAQPTYGKLFRVDSSGLNLQESRVVQPPAPVPSGIAGIGIYHLSNAYDLRAVDVSSDGQVLASTGFRDCIGDTIVCYKTADSYVTTITTISHSEDYAGNLRLSANGKWAFGGGSGEPMVTSVYGYLVNLTTGEQIQETSVSVSTFQVATSGRPVANDGTAVFSDSEAVVILQGTQIRRIPTQNYDQPNDAVIDASAKTIVYSVSAYIGSDGIVSPSGQKSLHVADVASGKSAMIASDGYAPSITDDGSTVLYLSLRDGTPQAWLIQTDGSGDRQLTEDDLGITQAILSGDGSVAYAVTVGGQLLSISTATGDVQELIPRTPFINPGQLIARGRLETLKGSGLVESAVTAMPPLPYSLASVQITIQGRPLVISSIEPGEITVLTPLDLTATIGPGPGLAPDALVQLDAASDSPFDRPITQVMIADSLLNFLLQQPSRSLNPYMVAVHEDWSAVVTPDNPARPGEVLHAYAVGLGPTDPVVPYGAAAPAEEPFARLVTRYQCSGGAGNEEVETLFEGLAPNLAGVYQIDWRVPWDIPEGDLVIVCGSGGPFLFLAGTVPVAP